MSISRLKNLTILGLALLCAALIVQVWFGDSFNRSYFFRFFPTIGGNGDYAYDDLLRPYRIILSDTKNSSYFIKYNDYDSCKLKAEADKAIRQILKNGEFAGSLACNYTELFAGDVIIYEYKAAMPADTFTRAHSQSGTILSSRFRRFNAVAVFPGDSKLRVVFVDYSQNIAYEYFIDKYADNEALFSRFTEEISSNHTTAYTMPVDTADGGRAVFVADWSRGSSLSYNPLTPYVPYEDNGGVRISNVESRVGFLFDNPGSVLSDNINDVFIFRDDTSVVRYFPGNVLEYAYYGSSGTKNESTFISAYTAALAVLKNDETLVNEYYLSGYSEQDSVWTFSFDITVNDFPIILSNSIIESLGMESMIEVTVSNDVVIKYKRIAYNFDVSTNKENASTNYQDAFSGVFGEQYESAAVTGVNLSYAADANSLVSTLKLSWLFEITYGNSDSETITVSFPAK